MLMATAVSKLAEKTPGKESVAIESFARALRQVSEWWKNCVWARNTLRLTL